MSSQTVNLKYAKRPLLIYHVSCLDTINRLLIQLNRIRYSIHSTHNMEDTAGHSMPWCHNPYILPIPQRKTVKTRLPRFRCVFSCPWKRLPFRNSCTCKTVINFKVVGERCSRITRQYTRCHFLRQLLASKP